jgi:NAD(P)-dependent dehydrogenase (short-subunit alcohol dehydrogenase family)
MRALRQQKQISFMGRSVVITGGSRGLGLILARQLADEGAKLTLLARTDEDLERAVEELQAKGADVLAIPCDVRDQEQVNHAIEQAIDHHGRIDVLINNAGIITVGPIEHMQIEDFEESLGIHMWGPLYTMWASIPHMREQGGGRIVNIASIGGKIAVPHLVPYCAGKFALVGLSDGMRAELGKDNIYVTTVNPGLMRTGSPPNAYFKGQNQAEYAWFTISDAMPGVSISAEEAAARIIEACRYGDPELTITPQAKLAAALNNVMPGLIANVMAITNRLLPGPTEGGNERKTGWESQSAAAPSVLTALSDQATVENNQLRPDVPLIEEQTHEAGA